ncbi:ABC transporter ATP-binding protein [Paenibacillus sp. GP183]|uniref:ABC transporter ATP-binding protein n=1 Tax=Paenibacillus sp. GP183 TaxID=1882751 RepID=UPI00089A3D2F|nr:ABC transporter ATP-binding protein [Paenibacillus sp. GP183]SEC80072.1 oligopeptide/dipeptide ABC transporter, ATP-binding protein, C-terminal domain-containing protein [Paenibacillus sp. GP183]
MARILEVKHLTTSFQTDKGRYRVVDRVNLHVDAGETVGIVGESGCGKSVTSLSIMRLVSHPGHIDPESQILLNGTDLNRLSDRNMRKIRGNDISMIFQEPMTSLNPVHSIGRQIGESLRIHQRLSHAEARQRAVEILTQVGISRAEQLVDSYPHHLSGGMRQRVMIAIAMSCTPKLMIADEPTTALDVTIQAQILELMKRLQMETNMAILMITHDLGVVAETCDRVMVMYAGKVVEEGSVRSIFNHPSHPYTKGLLASVPALDVKKQRLYSIPGSVPGFHEMPGGCRFAPRCAVVMDICRSKEPELELIGTGHSCSCFAARKGGEPA